MRLSGSITALATPFGADGSIDLQAWGRLLDAQAEAGTRAVVVAGSTGEAAALDEEEFVALIRAARARLPEAMAVIAGTGLSSTAKTIQRTRCAREAGSDAALVVTPPYVRATQPGLSAHYRAVAAEGGLPVVLYNVPGRTGCDLLPSTCTDLRDVQGIVGVKEAVADMARLRELLALRRDGFAVLSGDDPTACAAMLAGADGVVSVASNAAPRALARLCELALAGRREHATALDHELQPVFAFLGCEPNPIPVKALLARLGMLDDRLRLPLLPLSDSRHDACERMAAVVAALETRLHGAT